MNTTFSDGKQYDETTPVLIVGGSLVGLSTALFLSWHGIQPLLVERHPGVSPFIRAGGFSPRTMELYRSVGIEPAIRQKESQGLQNFMILRVESLAGKELGSYTQSVRDLSTPASPAPGSLITQDILEPILRAEAEKLGGDLRFNTQLLSSEQDADGVSAVIRDLSSGEKRTVRARYLIAADGNDSPLREHLGIKVHGPGTLSNQMFMIFKADLRNALRGRPVLFCYVSNPQVPEGAIGAYPDGLGGILSFSYHPEKGESEADFAGPGGIELVRIAVGEPNLDVELVSLRAWAMAAFVAERFQHGRIFFVGDSAHVMPPTGGFGANTGIADAHNLAWKLALVLKGQAGPDLLISYEAERRPVAQLTVDQAFANFVERMAPHLASQSTAPKIDHYAVILGYRYFSSAVLSSVEEGQGYENPNTPTARPGFRAPHVQ
ncbi:MAG TPA: FAD-dependent monooxygenase, partial [Ktedonobacteraceae bacterium]|nr:FAD-dependent monooxygenase [Ktedonobacteraceae bacterium]